MRAEAIKNGIVRIADRTLKADVFLHAVVEAAEIVE